jgi:uncharacterized protein
MEAQRQPMPGNRWHFQHGPIDVVIGADGDVAALQQAHEEAWLRFRGILTELCGELTLLRAPVAGRCQLKKPVARRMWSACHPYRHNFITPMAAVAGSVAQELISFYDRKGVRRAWVNNGGDIALHLDECESLRVGLFADLARLDAAALQGALTLDGALQVDASAPVRGIATSGWRGRSFSLGIADSVTVLARTAADADAAATVIGNAVNVHAAEIQRKPANQVREDSDLGDILVTVDVPQLSADVVHEALKAGISQALGLYAAGMIHSAVLVCQGWCVTTQAPVVIRPLRFNKLGDAPSTPLLSFT